MVARSYMFTGLCTLQSGPGCNSVVRLRKLVPCLLARLQRLARIFKKSGSVLDFPNNKTARMSIAKKTCWCSLRKCTSFNLFGRVSHPVMKALISVLREGLLRLQRQFYNLYALLGHVCANSKSPDDYLALPNREMRSIGYSMGTTQSGPNLLQQCTIMHSLILLCACLNTCDETRDFDKFCCLTLICCTDRNF